MCLGPTRMVLVGVNSWALSLVMYGVLLVFGVLWRVERLVGEPGELACMTWLESAVCTSLQSYGDEELRDET